MLGSFLYAKTACRFQAEGVKKYYALLMPDLTVSPPGPGRLVLLGDAIPHDMSARDLLDDITLYTCMPMSTESVPPESCR